MRAIKSLLLTGGLALCTVTAACATPLTPLQSARGPQLPDPGVDREYQVKFPEAGHGATRYIRLTLGDDIARDCGLVRTHFEFDSAEPLAEDHLALKSLAECLDRPGLRSLQLSLVGRADRRGSAEYNIGLALRRAERVKQILVDAGMPADRIRTSSTGARAAIGDDKLYSYGYDRRVDTVLDVIHAPGR